jgi:hypothetical protein
MAYPFKVIVEVGGTGQSGMVTNIIAPDDVEVIVVDWDNLNVEGIACPRCFGNDINVDASGDGDAFICNGCNYPFVWQTCVDCGRSWADQADDNHECPFCIEDEDED